MDLLLVILVGVVAVAVVTTLALRLGVAGPLLLGWKHGTVIVWAGMRGVVTLAAAQTIPRTVESRPELIYIAFVVALVSLMLQGFTLPWVVRKLRLSDPAEASDSDERERLDDELRTAAAAAVATGRTSRGATARRSTPNCSSGWGCATPSRTARTGARMRGNCSNCSSRSSRSCARG